MILQIEIEIEGTQNGKQYKKEFRRTSPKLGHVFIIPLLCTNTLFLYVCLFVSFIFFCCCCR